MEKDAAGCPSLPTHYGPTNPGTSRTSPAAYPTARTVLRGGGAGNSTSLPDRGDASVRRLADWIADLLRPWHDNGLPDALQFGEMGASPLSRGSMRRVATIAVSTGTVAGVFEILGVEYAQRAVGAWRPRELLLMEDVSLAFAPIYARVDEGRPVPGIHIDRAAVLLAKYLEYHGERRQMESLRESVQQFIQAASGRRPPDDENLEGTEESTARRSAPPGD